MALAQKVIELELSTQHQSTPTPPHHQHILPYTTLPSRPSLHPQTFRTPALRNFRLISSYEPHPLKGVVMGVSSNGHMIVNMSTARERRFFDACEAGDVGQISNLIADGVNPKEIVDKRFLNETPVHTACR